MSNGYTTTDLPQLATISDLLAHKDGTLGRVTLESLAAALTATNGPKYETAAELMSDLAWPQGTFGTVYEAGTFSIYGKSGPTDAGSWILIGAGDMSPQTAVQLAQKAASIAAQSANDLIAPSVSAAQLAQGLAEAARDATVSAGTWDYRPIDATALAAITGMTAGQTALVLTTMHVWQYSGSAWVDTGQSPLADRPTVTQTQEIVWAEAGFDYPQISWSDRFWRDITLDKSGRFERGTTVDAQTFEAHAGVVREVFSGALTYPLISAASEIVCDKFGRPVSLTTLDGTKYEAQNGVLVSIGKPASGAPRAYSFQYLTGLSLYATSEMVDVLFMLLGQSYPQGHDGGSTSIITTAPQHPGYALMAGLSSGVRANGNTFSTYADLYEVNTGTSLKETVCSGMADAMLRRINADLGFKPRLIFGVAAAGSNRYWDSRYNNGGIKRGTPVWANAMSYIRDCRDISAAQGRRLIVGGLVVMHGESDNYAEFRTTGNLESWIRILGQYQEDFEADARWITGQAERIPAYTYQIGFPTGAGLQNPVTAKAALEAARRNPMVRCFGPLGSYPGSTDGVHLSTTGYRELGTYLGNFVVQDLFAWGENPLQCVDAWWDGTAPVIHLLYNKPLGLESDDTLINVSGLGAGRGVDFTDGSSAPPAVTGIAVNGSDGWQLDVTLASVPTGRRPRVHVGCRATGSQHGSQQGLRSAIRSATAIDTDSLTGKPIYHWACTQSISLPTI